MSVLRHTLASIRMLLVMTVVLGIGYPLVVTMAAQVMPSQAGGSLISRNGQIVGSALIGQSFTDPQWFWSRPSASDYSGQVSGGTNLSPASDAQHQAREQRQHELEAANPDAVGPVPEDALTASGSGLDPSISVAYALWQVPRVARTRGIDPSQLRRLITMNTDRAPLGILGQDAVNVVRLNLALEQQ
jgi:K+-transporting ATPase, C subunit